MTDPVYRRVVIKLSGEYLAGQQGFGIDQPTLDRVADDLIAARQLGCEVAVVIGGGNIFRGVEVSSRGVSRPTGDTMGMLATMMNCLALEATIERKGTPARALSAFVMPEVSELFTRAAAHDLFARQKVTSIVFDVELIYLARRRGYRIAIVPIRWYDKRGSRMRASPTLAARVAWDLLRIPLIHRTSGRGARSRT